MQERELRDLIADVKSGRLSRRAFVQSMIAVGLTAPMAGLMLAQSGVAMAATGIPYKPTKAGGGGLLRLLYWQAVTLLNPHFAVGTKDQEGSRIFYEPLAGWDTDGNLLTPNHFAANAGGAGPLVNPWGVAKAPAHFGRFSHAILIGNIDDGRINAFDLAGNFLGTMRDQNGADIVIPALWDLIFGAPATNDAGELYFDAGPNIANFAGNGLFGIIAKRER